MEGEGIVAVGWTSHGGDGAGSCINEEYSSGNEDISVSSVL